LVTEVSTDLIHWQIYQGHETITAIGDSLEEVVIPLPTENGRGFVRFKAQMLD
jgi:hypothetical protein